MREDHQRPRNEKPQRNDETTEAYVDREFISNNLFRSSTNGVARRQVKREHSDIHSGYCFTRVGNGFLGPDTSSISGRADVNVDITIYVPFNRPTDDDNGFGIRG